MSLATAKTRESFDRGKKLVLSLLFCLPFLQLQNLNRCRKLPVCGCESLFTIASVNFAATKHVAATLAWWLRTVAINTLQLSNVPSTLDTRHGGWGGGLSLACNWFRSLCQVYGLSKYVTDTGFVSRYDFDSALAWQKYKSVSYMSFTGFVQQNICIQSAVSHNRIVVDIWLINLRV